MKLTFDRETKTVVLTDENGRSLYIDDSYKSHPVKQLLFEHIEEETWKQLVDIKKKHGSLIYRNFDEDIDTGLFLRSVRNLINGSFDGFVKSFESYGEYEDWVYKFLNKMIDEEV